MQLEWLLFPGDRNLGRRFSRLGLSIVFLGTGISWSNRFVRASFSGEDSNAPLPYLSVLCTSTEMRIDAERDNREVSKMFYFE